MPRQVDRGSSPRLVRQLAAALHRLRGELAGIETNGSGQVLHSLADDLDRDVSPEEATDVLAQAIVCGSAVAERFADAWHKCRLWLAGRSAKWEQFVLARIGSAVESRGDAPSSGKFGELTHLYEHLLRHDQPDRRKRAGVFYTPQPIVRYMLRQIDEQLREEFGLPLGLADEATWGDVRQREPSLKLPRGAGDVQPFVRLFDPAVGTGTFLLDAIDFIHGALVEHGRTAGCSDDQIAARWNDYVPRSLLPRLWGMELLPAPCFLARLHAALALAQTGYRFESPSRIEIHLGNTLAGPTAPLLVGRDSVARLDRRGAAAGEVPYDVPFTVVFGNPPFSYLSENQSGWITSLVRGEGGQSGYLEADGQKLGERKTWLHDDYVKFLRYSQWRIETTGCGIVGLVTNHGYLTNATFRILRQQLLRVFPRIAVIDLHGNRKAREVSPNGNRDENVFGLDQGIAIGLFCRPLAKMEPCVEHAELWGSRAEKFEQLEVDPARRAGPSAAGSASRSRSASGTCLAPAAPDFRFAPSAAEIHQEYAAAPSLSEILPVHATVPVTARDHFVVAFTRSELQKRVQEFRDLSISDDELRSRYFTRTRSARYTPGDTRGWKLIEARRAIAALDDWASFIQPCQYRPLDWRWIFWHPAMIDWPRAKVTRVLLSQPALAKVNEGERGGGGEWETDHQSSSLPLAPSPTRLALIARRQLPPSEPCNYFWATTAIALDGIIRNDNRGSESLFPTAAVAGPTDIALYAYALFHSPTYRQRYVGQLRTDFPRVCLPRDDRLRAALADLGGQLLEWHTQSPPLAAAGRSQQLLLSVAPRFPQYADGRIWIRDDYSVAAADEATWQFRVGAHQVARKWLADRRGRPLTEADLAWYGIILDTIGQTRRLMAAVDAAIDEYGGFPQAFRDC